VTFLKTATAVLAGASASELRSGRVIAFYLPQYHPIPENDLWWGRGFTEWTNTAKATAMFGGHYQPHVPADLGFYDLRAPEAREAQAQLARDYGIEAFCYYHYWFAGRRLLQRPFEEVLASGKPDFPFCLCWANQSWTGIWHGAPNRLLIEQTYPGEDDHRRHFATLLRAFVDPRYVRVDGRPLFIVYSPDELPEPRRTADLWRCLAIEAGLPGLFLVGENRTGEDWNPTEAGFDARVDVRLPPRRKTLQSWATWRHPLRKLRYRVADWRGLPTIHRYEHVSEHLVGRHSPGIEAFPCAIPNWDNTPRSGSNGMVLHGSTPELFRRHLRKAMAFVADYSEQHRLVFIKSWNEWAEGNHLEPDLRYGRQYLEVVRDEVLGKGQR
jgi:lipopolysaccharide biosynthesis protein